MDAWLARIEGRKPATVALNEFASGADPVEDFPVGQYLYRRIHPAQNGFWKDFAAYLVEIFMHRLDSAENDTVPDVVWLD